MPTINDPDGTPVGINHENRLKGEAVCTSEGSHYSQHEQELYSWLISDNTSGAEYVAEASMAGVAHSKLTIAVTTAGNSNTGTLYLYIR